MSADHSDEVTYVLQQLGDLYTPEQAQQWLTTPHAMLGGRSAAELINEGKADEVLRVINRLRDGSRSNRIDRGKARYEEL